MYTAYSAWAMLRSSKEDSPHGSIRRLPQQGFSGKGGYGHSVSMRVWMRSSYCQENEILPNQGQETACQVLVFADPAGIGVIGATVCDDDFFAMLPMLLRLYQHQRNRRCRERLHPLPRSLSQGQPVRATFALNVAWCGTPESSA